MSCGAVVIGRNEGQRLAICLESLIKQVKYIVYVDSGSIDGSVNFAKSLGIEIVSLDMSIPFTAARARNEGAKYLLGIKADLKYLQFVDGDCEVQAGWIEKAFHYLEDNSQYAVVCGRRRERFPEQSIYNQLCDIEWNTPVGDALACGGDALIRMTVFQEINGFREDLIAGEEPEMCFRLRALGWKIRRIEEEMTLHDAAMSHFSQWWNRSKRAGYAYSQGCYLHGQSAEKYKIKQMLSILFWGLGLPAFIMVISFIEPSFLLAFGVYPLQIIRLAKKQAMHFESFGLSLCYALSNVVGKFPQIAGVFKFLVNKLKGHRGTLIEYK